MRHSTRACSASAAFRSRSEAASAISPSGSGLVPSPASRRLEEAVDDEVGIAADGRGEMGVIGLGQAVVADVLGRIDGQLHRPQDLGADELLAGQALGLFEDPLQVLRPDLVRVGQGQPERPG